MKKRKKKLKKIIHTVLYSDMCEDYNLDTIQKRRFIRGISILQVEKYKKDRKKHQEEKKKRKESSDGTGISGDDNIVPNLMKMQTYQPYDNRRASLLPTLGTGGNNTPVINENSLQPFNFKAEKIKSKYFTTNDKNILHRLYLTQEQCNKLSKEIVTNVNNVNHSYHITKNNIDILKNNLIASVNKKQQALQKKKKKHKKTVLKFYSFSPNNQMGFVSAIYTYILPK